ncbi:MAG: glycosyltransferase family 39 protein, partial [Planctomycetes bacterium]|nr:glycosyltransferase family 39 protein [Planctomycetota bacterium]
MKSPTSIAVERRARRWLRPWHVALAWGLAMLPLVPWGLPSARYDALLFDGQAWPPERYQPTAAIARLSERDAGADTDMDPLAHRDEIIDLTVDDAARAQILTRYRLYSHQPDEMITFRALQRMKPRERDFDPRLFQYGGAFVYLVGTSLGAAAGLGLVTVTSNLGVYLTNPGLFAAFYIVARLVTLAFGAASLPLVFRIAARAGGRRAGWIALVLTAFAPVFICGSLEAKPHLPAVFFCLLTIDLALRRIGENGNRRALALGAAAGGACGMVLTGAAALTTLVANGLLSRRTPRSTRHFGIAIAAAAGVYGVTNP